MKKPTNQTPQNQYARDIVPVADELNWGLIILFLFVLPPFGIYYATKKIIIENRSYYKNGTRLVIIGAVIMALALLSLVLPICEYSVSGNVSSFVIRQLTISAFLMAFGVIITVIGSIIRHIGAVNDRLLKLITCDGITEINELARLMKTSNARVIEKVKALIENGILTNAYYYPYDNEIIVFGISKKVAIMCKNCTGTTVLYSNSKRICTYCEAEL